MKRLLAAASLAALCGMPARADIVDYAKLLGGIQIDATADSDCCGEFDMATGYNVGGGLGWNVGTNLAVEADFFYAEADRDDLSGASIETFSFMGNLIYNFGIAEKTNVYLGAGLGGVQTKYVFKPFGSDSDVVFGYQGIVGISTSVDDKIDGFVEYRYQSADSADVDIGLGPFTLDTQTHNLSAGLRFNM